MKQLTCIVCPNGCRVSAESTNGKHVFSGNKCPRGADFAEAELTAPIRSVTTTVRTVFSDMPALPVRTKGEIPKERIPELIRALADIVVKSRLGIGETVAENILGTGVDVIATSNTLKSVEERMYRHVKSARTDHRFGDTERQRDTGRSSRHDSAQSTIQV